VRLVVAFALLGAGLAAGMAPAGAEGSGTTIELGQVTVAEGDAGTTAVELPVTLSGPAPVPVTVQWTTTESGLPGSVIPTAGQDFVSAGGTITLPPGDTTAAITIEIIGDTIPEPDETLLVQLYDPVDVTLAGDPGGLGKVVIEDDDTPPRLTPGLAHVTEGDDGTTTVEVPVTLSDATDEPVTATWQTIHGPGVQPPNPATPGTDFTTANGTITIPAGQTSTTITLEITGDTTPEADEYVVVAFSNPTGAILGGYYGLGFAVIDDDDTPPTIRPGTSRTTEGDDGITILNVPVTLTQPTTETVTVDWQTTRVDTSCSGTTIPASCATPDVDYLAADGTLTFAPGETTAVVPIEVIGDLVDEQDEILYVRLSNPTNALLDLNLRTPSAFIDDDDAIPTPTGGQVTVAEGDAGVADVVLPVTLATAPTKQVTLHWRTMSGSGCPVICLATAGQDFIAASDSVTFFPGQTTADVIVEVYGDTTAEPDEHVVVEFTDPATGTPLTYGRVIIEDDDTPDVEPPPTLQSASIPKVEGDAGSTSVQLPVSLSKPWHEDITITWATEPGSGCAIVCQATVGVDYAAASGTLTIPAGQTSASITLTVYGDTTVEPDEIFAVGFTAPATSNRFLYGTVRITNDD
jgi:hypothetical protein